MTVTLQDDPQTAEVHRPESQAVDITIDCAREVAFTLKIRLPWWLAGAPAITVNGTPLSAPARPSSFYAIRRTWHHDRLRVVLPKRLAVCPLPDRPGTVAFMDGPLVLAGLVDEGRVLYGDPSRPQHDPGAR